MLRAKQNVICPFFIFTFVVVVAAVVVAVAVVLLFVCWSCLWFVVLFIVCCVAFLGFVLIVCLFVCLFVCSFTHNRPNLIVLIQFKTQILKIMTLCWLLLTSLITYVFVIKMTVAKKIAKFQFLQKNIETFCGLT